MPGPDHDLNLSPSLVLKQFEEHSPLFEKALAELQANTKAAKPEVMPAPAPPAGGRRGAILYEIAVRCLTEETKERRRESQEKLMENDYLLGKVLQSRGPGAPESWVDGVRPRTLRQKLAELEKQRNEVKSQGREIRKLPDSYHQRLLLEINKRKLEVFRRNEMELREELAEFALEKALHIKEFRRMRDETMSALFYQFPVLDNGRYLVLHLLGRGGFSEVWKAMDMDTCNMVAVKVHQLSSAWSASKKQQYRRHARREYDIQKAARHKRIVSLIDCFELSENSFCTVLEYTPFGDLDSFLKKHKDVQETTVRPLMAQILSGLAYLHSQKVIHYDLKPANVLFFSPSEIKLTDFGLSKSLAGSAADGEETAIELTSQGAGTYWYLPPECFETRWIPKVTAKVDIWAAGVVFYQMLFGKCPFGHGSSQKQLFTEGIIFNARNVTFPPKPKVSEAAKSIVRQCLEYKPSNRPTASDLLTDPYFFQSTVGPGAKKMQQITAATIVNRNAQKCEMVGKEKEKQKRDEAPDAEPTTGTAVAAVKESTPQKKRKKP
eukprot:TRINITY_DN5753_c0_g1_i3.p1 TRINITY_DN5753_c0_g1~~TRINITY_DN5753_c0_g1_i3.p1  ORF type:complete len:550 (+),score=118.45 TRINITY_DN5753_c0_g1_i3:161-1810(+)